jgi:predicted transcriptional regulator
LTVSEREKFQDYAKRDDRTELADGLRSFASWKFTILDALASCLDAREFQVAYCLLQCADSKSRAIFPSQARIAALVGRDTSSVKRAISKMIKLGVLRAARKNMRRSNSYVFDEAKLDEFVAIRKIRLAEYEAKRWAGMTAQMCPFKSKLRR